MEYNWKTSKCLQYRKGEEMLIIDKKRWNGKKAPKQKYIIPWEVIKVCRSGNTYKIELINPVIHVLKKEWFSVEETHTFDWGKKQETIWKESFSEQVYIVSIDFPADRNLRAILLITWKTRKMTTMYDHWNWWWECRLKIISDKC